MEELDSEQLFDCLFANTCEGNSGSDFILLLQNLKIMTTMSMLLIMMMMMIMMMLMNMIMIMIMLMIMMMTMMTMMMTTTMMTCTVTLFARAGQPVFSHFDQAVVTQYFDALYDM